LEKQIVSLHTPARFVVATAFSEPPEDGKKVMKTYDSYALLRHKAEDGNIRLLAGRDKLQFPGQNGYFIGRTPTGELPYWEEREPDILTVRHGVGNIFFNDGQDRHLVEGKDQISLIGRALPDGSVVAEEYVEESKVEEPTDIFDKNAFYDLRDHPSHKMAIARMAVSFVQMEHSMATLFAWMMQAPPPHANSAFFALVNNKARLDMLSNLIQWLHQDIEVQFLKHTLELIKEAAKYRNCYCHALWKRSNEKVYIVENIASTYPSGTKRFISGSEIESHAGLVESNADSVAKMIKGFVSFRPIFVSQNSIKPSFLEKFRRGHKLATAQESPARTE
jgi:hypothetical protein